MKRRAMQVPNDCQKHRLSFKTLLTILSVLLSFNASSATGKRVALVIGNDGYQGLPQLNNARTDARGMANKLKSLGFETVVKLNADLRTLGKGLSEFEQKLTGADVGLVFYAGHGIQANGQNYLIPVDAQLESETDLRFGGGVALNEVLNSMKLAGSKLNIVILDACRDNPLPKKGRSAGRGLAVSSVPSGMGVEGTAILYSAAPGQVAQDGPRGGHGIFTGELLKVMDQSNVLFEQIFKQVATRVAQKTGNRQEPWMNSSIKGDFYFNASEKVNNSVLTPAQAGNTAIEIAFWDSIKNSNDPKLFQAYLDQYPSGSFASLARIKVSTALNSSSTSNSSTSQEIASLYPLTVITEPSDARIRILNINPKFYQGIELKPGRYQVEVSKAGYKKSTRWFDLRADQTEYEVFLNEVHQRQPFEPEMIRISGGSFQMGSNGGDDDEKPVHRVSIAAFKLAKHEVTVDQFRRFIQATGYRTDADKNTGGKDGCYAYKGGTDFGWTKGTNWENPGYSQSGNHPVVCVSWNDTQAYIEWLNRETGHRYRLPSEAEWEYAARAGSTSKYHFGNSKSLLCTYGNVGDQTLTDSLSRWTSTTASCNDGYTYTAPVGRYLPNDAGLKDMIGNVWEWTEDCRNDSYNGAPGTGRPWKSGNCKGRVMRGGSWIPKQSSLRSADRGWSYTVGRYDASGFRLAQDL